MRLRDVFGYTLEQEQALIGWYLTWGDPFYEALDFARGDGAASAWRRALVFARKDVLARAEVVAPSLVGQLRMDAFTLRANYGWGFLDYSGRVGHIEDGLRRLMTEGPIGYDERVHEVTEAILAHYRQPEAR